MAMIPLTTRGHTGIHDPDQWAPVILFGAACLYFATLEYLIPKPVPFFRIGLSNLPLMLAIPLLRGRDILALTVVKVVGQGLVGGTLASYVFLFSAGGSLASMALMYGLWKLAGPRLGWMGMSLAGALASNTVQIVLSIAFVFGPSARVIAPLFMGLGLAGGVLVGWAAAWVQRESRWYAHMMDRHPPRKGLPGQGLGGFSLPSAPRREPRKPKPRRRSWLTISLPRGSDILEGLLSPRAHMAMALLVLPAFLFQDDPVIRVLEVLFWMLMALLAGKRLQLGYFLMMVGTITLFSLVNPSGRVLWEIPGLTVTEGALKTGLYKGLGIVGMVFISLAAVRPSLPLPGLAGHLLGRILFGWEFLLAFKRRRDGTGIDGFMGLVDEGMEGLEGKLATWEAGASTERKPRPWGPFVVALVALFHWVMVIFI